MSSKELRLPSHTCACTGPCLPACQVELLEQAEARRSELQAETQAMHETLVRAVSLYAAALDGLEGGLVINVVIAGSLVRL